MIEVPWRPAGLFGCTRQLFSAGLAALLLSLLVAEPSGADTRYGLGSVPSEAEIAAVNIDIMPDGRGLPPGEGSVLAGSVIYGERCSQCHGARGRDGSFGPLAGAQAYTPEQLAADDSLPRTVGNYWPFATSLFDYVRRAMPYDAPGSLQDSEVYAVTAYLLFLNGLLDETASLDRQTLPGLEMPARRYYRSDGKVGESQ